jgi:hypothetical protein
MEPEGRFICENMKIASYEHASINFIAVLCIVAAATVLSLISFSEPWLAKQEHWPWLEQRLWISNSLLHLLKSTTSDLSHGSNYSTVATVSTDRTAGGHHDFEGAMEDDAIPLVRQTEIGSRRTW